MEEELKLKYRNLYYNVSNINNKLSTIIYKLNELYICLNSNAIINDRTLENDNLYTVKSKINNVSNELNNSVLPSLKYKSF